MLRSDAQSRLAVVLVGARNPQNIGAAARAMQDFGFSDLRVVNEFTPPFEAAQLEAKSAVGAGQVMQAARRFSDLAEAIADCTVVAGTTAIGGRKVESPILRLKEAAPILRSGLSTGSESGGANEGARVALLFGSEKTGLTRDQLSYCSHLLTIPMFAPVGRHLSMNLGQSVAVCLYELTREGFEGARALPSPKPPRATVSDRDRLTALLQETMEYCGYSARFPANARPTVLRHLVTRLSETREEAATWMGVFRMILRILHPADAAEQAPDQR